MLLVLGQDGAQVRPVQDQGPVRTSRRKVPIRRSQSADQALADRVHPRRLHRDTHDGGAGGLKDGIEGAVKFQPLSRIRQRTSPNRSPRSRARLRVCWTVHALVGCAVTPPRCIQRVPCSMNTRHEQPFQQHRVNVQEVNGQDSGGLGVQELPPRRA